MKRSFQVTLLGLMVSVGVVAGTLTVADVNSRIVALLNPFNNSNTLYQFEFTQLKMDAVRALDFGAIGKFFKKGPANEFLLSINDLAYTYGDGSNPAVNVDFKIDLDLVKAFGQETVNILADNFTDVVQEMVKEYGQKYGTAVAVNSVVDSLVKDPNGNVQSMSLRLDAIVDMTKLPVSLNRSEVEFKKLSLNVSISSLGLSARGKAIVNPEYKGFRADQNGLKNYIEKLLSNDSSIYSELAQIVSFADQAISGFVQAGGVKTRSRKN